MDHHIDVHRSQAKTNDSASSAPPPVKKVKTTAVSVKGQLLPQLDMADLFAGTSNQVIAKASPESNEVQTFTVNRALLCGYSEYFAGAFTSGFAKSDKKSI